MKWLRAIGRFFRKTRDKLISWVDLSAGLDTTRADTTRTVSSVVDALVETGDTEAFREAFREEIKRLYIEQYLAGIGGINSMTQADWGSIGGSIADQYRYLDGFIQDILDGKLSEAQIRARANMYLNSAREAFERAKARVAEKLGMKQEIWVLDGGEHCVDCVAYGAEGPQPLGHFPKPGDGSTQCLTNCLCHLEYVNAETGETYGG